MVKKFLVKILESQEIGLERGKLAFIKPSKLDVLSKEVLEYLTKLTNETFKHIGSSAVDGFLCKPIIDILLPYKGKDLRVQTIENLVNMGFTYKGDYLSKVNPDKKIKPCRHFFTFYNDTQTKDYIHIHALPEMDPECLNLIRLVDILNKDINKRQIYASFKKMALDQSLQRKEYRNMKSSIIKKLLL